MRYRRPLLALGSALLGCVAGLLFCELGLRLWLASAFGGGIENASHDIPIDPSAPLEFGDLIRPDADPRIIYRLKPGLKGTFQRAVVETNSLGLRDEEIPLEKPAGTTRVAFVGDSSAFGWGARIEQTYPRLIEAALNGNQGDGTPVECINGAVPGYTAAQEVEFFLAHISPFGPDLVIVQYDLNDIHLPEFLLKPSFFAPDQLYLSFIPEIWKGTLAHPDGRFMRYQLRESDHRYRAVTGWPALAAAYRRLRDFCRERRVPLIAVIPPLELWDAQPELLHDPRYDDFRALCAELEIECIDVLPTAKEYAVAHGLASKDVMVGYPTDLHPNALGHALMARAILPAVAAKLGLAESPSIPLPERPDTVELAAGKALSAQGLFAAETWNGTSVSWCGRACALRLPKLGDAVWVRYFVGHPDVAKGRPVGVAIRLNGGTPIHSGRAEKGLAEVIVDLAGIPGGEFELEIASDRAFIESPGGRELGVALYPFVFEKQQD